MTTRLRNMLNEMIPEVHESLTSMIEKWKMYRINDSSRYHSMIEYINIELDELCEDYDFALKNPNLHKCKSQLIQLKLELEEIESVINAAIKVLKK